MKIKKFIFTLTGLFFLGTFTSIFAFEPISTTDLLLSYLENDSDLKKNVLNAEKIGYSLDSTKISNGFDITLSTGKITISSKDGGTKISAVPSIDFVLPQASNLKITVSPSINYQDGITSFDDSKFKISGDIISSAGLQRQITLLKAERNLTEAKRKVMNQAIISEKAFYTELKELLAATNNIINLQKTLYTNNIDFEKIKAQGYSSGSSTYRLAQMKQVSTEHEIDISSRSLIHSYITFYKKCGYDIVIDDSLDFYSLVPSDIQEIEPLDIHSFNSELYSEIENALWTNKINSMARKAEKNFTLGADGGFTFANSTTKSSTVDVGLSSTIWGVNLGAGVSIPLENQNAFPAFTFSASITPNAFRLISNENHIKNLDEKQELLAIETARSNYETKVVECEQSLVDLQWTKKSDFESYEMYVALENDLSKWFKDGFITESEYFSAKVNVQSYFVKTIINNINLIIYNDNIVTMFVDDMQEEQND